MKIKGQFVSVWTDGTVQTPCELDPVTGELFPETVEVSDLGSLEREYFQTPDGDFEVCPDCHGYILKTVVNPGIGHTLNEEQVCSNQDCVKENY